MVGRLRREAAVSGSGELLSLLAEIESHPGGFEERQTIWAGWWFRWSCTSAGAAAVVPEHRDDLRYGLDLTAAELSIEAFLPADEATAAALGVTGLTT